MSEARAAVHEAFRATALTPVPDTSTTVVRWWEPPLIGSALPPGGVTATLTPLAGGTRITVQGVRVDRERLELLAGEGRGWQARLGCYAQTMANHLGTLPPLRTAPPAPVRAQRLEAPLLLASPAPAVLLLPPLPDVLAPLPHARSAPPPAALPLPTTMAALPDTLASEPKPPPAVRVVRRGPRH